MKEVRLKNFRSYKDEQVIEELSSVNMFIGPNAAGKSNVIEAFKYLSKLLRKQEPKPFKELVFDRDENSEIGISLCFQVPSRDRRRIIDRLFKDNPNVSADEIAKNPFLRTLTYSVTIKKEGVAGVEIKTSNIVNGEVVVIHESREGKNIITKSVGLDSMCNQISSIENVATTLSNRGKHGPGWDILKYSGLSPSEFVLIDVIKRFMNNWETFEPGRQVEPRMEPGEEADLDSRGSNLTKFMQSLQGSAPRRFVGIVDEIIAILPSIREILAPFRERFATLTVEEEGLTTPTPVGDLSYGLMQILVLVVGILTKKNGSVIFIEEPELHLHATSQRRLFQLIQKEAKNKQFLLTTHSTIFTAHNKQNRTYLFTKPHGVTLVKKIEDPQELRTVKTTLGHRNTDLFGDEVVVFIEGDSEDVAFPIIANSLGYNLVEKGIRLVNIRGSGKAKKIGEYLRYLKDSGIVAYVIADGDKDLKRRLEDWEREGTILSNFWTIWELEFEDCFSLEMIANAINERLKEEETSFQLTVEDLSKDKKAGVSIVRVLKKILHSNDLILDKPALAERLAYLSTKDEDKKGHKETLPEKEIKKIMNIVEPTTSITVI